MQDKINPKWIVIALLFIAEPPVDANTEVQGLLESPPHSNSNLLSKCKIFLINYVFFAPLFVKLLSTQTPEAKFKTFGYEPTDNMINFNNFLN